MADSLQKIIGKSGYCSRRKAEKIIREGHVTVNGKVVMDPSTKVSERDVIRINGKLLNLGEEKFYYAFYKPRNCLCTLKDPLGRKTILEYLPRELRRKKIIIAGRLDFHHTGLVILTNDGEFANYITHPGFGVMRTYQIKLNCIPDEKQFKKILKRLPETKRLKGNWIVTTVPAGHEKKIMIAFLNAGVLPDKVLRTGIGNIHLGNMKPGEIKAIKKPYFRFP